MAGKSVLQSWHLLNVKQRETQWRSWKKLMFLAKLSFERLRCRWFCSLEQVIDLLTFKLQPFSVFTAEYHCCHHWINDISVVFVVLKLFPPAGHEHGGLGVARSRQTGSAGHSVSWSGPRRGRPQRRAGRLPGSPLARSEDLPGRQGKMEGWPVQVVGKSR